MHFCHTLAQRFLEGPTLIFIYKTKVLVIKMAILDHITNHAFGEPFRRSGYSNDELTQFVHLIRTNSPVNFSLRCLNRAQDLGLNFNEMDRAIAEGEVVAHDVGPSKTEIRLEIRGTKGDVAAYQIVVYLSKEHDLHAEDVRTMKLG
jgi:hypothetical protein